MKITKSQITILISCLVFSLSISAQTFVRVSEAAGLSTKLKPVFGNPVWGDMNNDGFIDLIAPHHGAGPSIYMNNRDGSFTRASISSVFGADFFNEHRDLHGFSFTDFNNDNVLDIFMTAGAKRGEPGFVKRDRLYQGSGDGTFQMVSTAAGVENPTGRGRSSCWFDYDGDGNLDFFLKNLAMTNVFYRNAGDGTFTDISTSLGLYDVTKGSVCSLVDYDNDGWLDIFLNSGGITDTLLRQLPDGTFSDVTVAANITPLSRGSAAAWGDYNNDGFMDLFVARALPETYDRLVATAKLDNTLYTNNGDGSFTDSTVAAGLAGNFNTAAAVWGDIDNDGNLDLLVTNAGDVDGSGNNNLLYMNNGDGSFTESAAQFNIDGSSDPVAHRYTTVALGDYDNDGALDVVLDGGSVGSNKGTTELYHNEGGSNNYLKLVLKGVSANAPGIGSVVRLSTANVTQMRQYTGATSGVRKSQSLQPVHFGVGNETAVSLNVLWPKGERVPRRTATRQTVSNLAVNQTVVLEEGRSIARGRVANMSEPGCYLWAANRRWNLRCIGKTAQRVLFSGRITSNGKLTSLNSLSIEANDMVSSTENAIAFAFNVKQGYDTISFTSTGDAVTFDIYQDGVQQPRSIRIGKYAVLPAMLPVTLTE